MNFFGKNKVSAKLSVLKNGHFSFCPRIGVTTQTPPPSRYVKKLACQKLPKVGVQNEILDVIVLT